MTDRPEKALPDVNRALELDPSSNHAWDTRAVCYMKLGDYDKALEDINRAIEINPGYAEHFYHRGRIYVETGNWLDAYDDLLTAQSLDEDVRDDLDELIDTVDEKVVGIFERKRDESE